MTDKNTFVNEGRDRATDDRSPHAHRGWTGFLAHRWPTAVGVVLAALTAFDLRIDAESVPSFSARACWWRSTRSRSSAGYSWQSASSATQPGTPSITRETGWSRVRTRSSAL